MIPISVINTSASFANQLAGVQKLGAQADRDHLRGLARCYAASYGFGWYHYQHDPAALTIELTKRQVPIADDPPSFQWTPMLAFRSWRGVSDEREASGLSGDLQTRSG